MRLVLEIVTLVAGAVAMLALLPTASHRTRAAPQPKSIQRPADLEMLERVAVARATAGEVHSRLRPVLREIAAARVRRHGVQLDRSPAAARELLGERLWELVRADRPRPDDVHAPGLAIEELEAIVARLERL